MIASPAFLVSGIANPWVGLVGRPFGAGRPCADYPRHSSPAERVAIARGPRRPRVFSNPVYSKTSGSISPYSVQYPTPLALLLGFQHDRSALVGQRHHIKAADPCLMFYFGRVARLRPLLSRRFAWFAAPRGRLEAAPRSTLQVVRQLARIRPLTSSALLRLASSPPHPFPCPAVARHRPSVQLRIDFRAQPHAPGKSWLAS